MPKQVIALKTYQEYARQLLAEYDNTYFKSAQALGHKNLRAGIWLLLNKDHPPSPRLRDALEHWALVKPVIVECTNGSSIFGEVGLLDLGQVVAVLIMRPKAWERHSIFCKICQQKAPRWSSTQKYCAAHSYSTPEGRRYHRKNTVEKARGSRA